MIQTYQFGRIEIDGTTYRNDVKLIGKTVVPDWWRSRGHFVQPEDVQDLLRTDAEFCVFGTGAYGAMRISEAVMSELEGRGTNVIVEATESACETYNRLLREGKSVVAGFHLTC